MINFVRNVYNSPDLHGDFLVVPLRSYHAFSAEKMHSGSWLAKSALVVAGVFAYSILGVVAAVGILVKLTGIPSVRSHNKKQMKNFSDLQELITCMMRASRPAIQEADCILSKPTPIFFKHYEFTEENAEIGSFKVSNALKRCIEEFREINFKATFEGDKTSYKCTFDLFLKK